jgi:ATP-dependent Clp protease ATP-binding subunit ClpX
MQYVAPQDLRAFGLIPEIVGRLPIVTYLCPLDKIILRRILTEPKDSIIKQYIKLFDMDKIKLHFEDDVLDFIVERSMEFKLGARGLRSICEVVMIDAMYELPSKEVAEINITVDYAREKLDKANLGRLKAA